MFKCGIYVLRLNLLVKKRLEATRPIPCVGTRERGNGWLRSEAKLHTQKYDGWTYNHAGSVHQLVIHLYIAKQPLFNNLHAAIPPLDGQTLPESRQEIEIFS